jgi:AraC-like DNA-binding protein
MGTPMDEMENRYRRQIRSSLDFIEERLKEGFSLQEAASKANASLYHFYRLFRAFTGCSLAEYIRERRLESAAWDLARPDRLVRPRLHAEKRERTYAAEDNRDRGIQHSGRGIHGNTRVVRERSARGSGGLYRSFGSHLHGVASLDASGRAMGKRDPLDALAFTIGAFLFWVNGDDYAAGSAIASAASGNVPRRKRGTPA